MPNKKKVLLEAYDCDPNKGSEFGRSWNWALNYANAGYEVCCLTSVRGKKGIQNYIKKNDIPNLNFVFVTTLGFLDKKALKGDSALLYLHYLLWLAKVFKTAKKLTKDHRFEFAHHVSWGSLQGGSHLWRLNLPLVFGPVGGGQYPPKIFKRYFYKGWRAEQIRKVMGFLFVNYNPNTIQTLKKAVITLVVNQDTERLAKKLGAYRVRSFIDINLFASSIPSSYHERPPNDILKILWVGGLKFRKGLPLVLEALSHVPQDIPFHLTIYGDGEFAKYLPGLIDKMNLKDQVTWEGNVPYSQLQSAYLSHDVFMFCTMRESLGLQFFEAMSYGLPIITLNLHGAKTAVPDEASIKVNISSERSQVINDLSQAVVFIQKDYEKRVEMGRYAYCYTKKLIAQNKVKMIEDMLDKANE